MSKWNPFAINRSGREEEDPINPGGESGNGLPSLQNYIIESTFDASYKGRNAFRNQKLDTQPFVNMMADEDGDIADTNERELLYDSRYSDRWKTESSDLTIFDVMP